MAVVTGVDTVGGFYILMSPGIIQWLMVSPPLLPLPQRKMSPQYYRQNDDKTPFFNSHNPIDFFMG